LIKRILEISGRAFHLSVRDDQLRLQAPGHSKAKPLHSVPCEDLGVLVIEHPQVTFSQSVITRLTAWGATIVFCGPDHLPAALALPVSRNTEVVSRLQDQIAASKPRQKRIWQQLVIAKIRAQAENLPHDELTAKKLRVLAGQVRSGDPANVEAHAARLYWGVWLDSPPGGQRFRRDIEGDGINALLNYGYAILRAAVARALVSAGLQPALGIHHKNRSNAFALADDLLEPLRPLVDRTVQALARQGLTQLTSQGKRELLALLHALVEFNGQTGPLMVVLHRYTAGFLRCLQGREKKLVVPRQRQTPPPPAPGKQARTE